MVCCDPYVADPSLIPVEEAISRADTIIIGVPHTLYRGLEIPASKTVVDVWGSRESRRPRALSAPPVTEETKA